MEEATGRTAGNMDNFTGNNGPQIDIFDSGLQRHLSRLQIIDILARQVDRNQANFWLQTDENGHVTKVTGIDNDMSFGSRETSIDSIKGMGVEYPGLSAFVDKDIAMRILKVKPTDIIYILSGLLPEAEIVQTVSRLSQMQIYLQQLLEKGKLLEPHQWNEATAKGLINEGKSYYQKLARTVLGMGKYGTYEDKFPDN